MQKRCSAVPDGFGATAGEYLAWLVGALEQLGEPVDLVGHDVGGSLARSSVETRGRLGAELELAAQRPGLALVASGDGFVGTDEQRLRSARRAGGWVTLLEGSEHWWMTQDDGSVGADALTGFWTALANGRG